VRNRFAVTHGACHGEVIEELRQSSCVIHVDVGEENIVDPVNAPGCERVDEPRQGSGRSDINNYGFVERT